MKIMPPHHPQIFNLLNLFKTESTAFCKVKHLIDLFEEIIKTHRLLQSKASNRLI